MFYGMTVCDGDGCADPSMPSTLASRCVAVGTFDHPGESAGDALASMAAAGWRVGADGSTLCPACAERGAAILPAGEAMRRLVAIVKTAQ